MRKWFIVLLVSVVLFSFGPVNSVLGSEGRPEPLPKLSLLIPENQDHLEYLGITGTSGDSFDVEDINADILLIELFSMYCPFCQEEAPNVNELYEKMQNLPADGPQVKIIGLGAGNTLFEVNHFKSVYDVRFPLFPDEDLSMYKSLEGAGTPGFIGVKMNTEQGAVIVLRQSGGFNTADEFLKRLLTSAGKD